MEELSSRIINSLNELDKLQRNRIIKDTVTKIHNLSVTVLMKSENGKEIPSKTFEQFIAYVNAGAPISGELIHKMKYECTKKELEILRKHGININK